VAKGAAEAASSGKVVIVEFHYPASRKVTTAVTHLKKALAPLQISAVTHPPPAGESSKEAWNHACPLAQLSAMEASNAVIAIGGTLDGPKVSCCL